MKYVLTDGSLHESLKPFTWTRAVSDLRVGILCIREKWSKFTGTNPELLTTEELQPLYAHPSLGEAVYIQAGILPNSQLVAAIEGLQLGDVLVNDQGFIAYRSLRFESEDQLSALKSVSYSGPIIRI
ncbi:MAG: putative sugar nucleotidyl transferase, partial [Flavobacteriaceae bacterium]